MASNNYIYKMSNAGGMSTLTRYTDMLAGNATWNPWEPAGAYESIAAVTVPSGGVASITFSSIPNTYAHLQVRIFGRDNRGIFRDFVGINFNNDFGSNYAYHGLSGDGGSASSFAATSQSEIQFISISASGANNANGFGVSVVDVLDYANSSKNTTVRGLGGYDDNGQGIVLLQSGLWLNTASVSQLDITPGVGTSFSQHTQIALYGIKG